MNLEDKMHGLHREEPEKLPTPFGKAQEIVSESQTLDIELLTQLDIDFALFRL